MNIRKLLYLTAAIASSITVSLATPNGAKDKDSGTVFVGDISDSMCGLQHPMADKKRCTLGCVKGFDGTTFVLADQEHKKVYNLSDQKKAKAFAGEKVEVR
jgi:hypothetical protein